MKQHLNTLYITTEHTHLALDYWYSPFHTGKITGAVCSRCDRCISAYDLEIISVCIMLYLISYDVSTSTPAGKKRLRQVAKVCEDYGVRVQSSVFECVMDYTIFLRLKSQLCNIIDPGQDSLRFYPIGKKGRDKVIHVGVSTAPNVEAPLVF